MFPDLSRNPYADQCFYSMSLTTRRLWSQRWKCFYPKVPSNCICATSCKCLQFNLFVICLVGFSIVGLNPCPIFIFLVNFYFDVRWETTSCQIFLLTSHFYATFLFCILAPPHFSITSYILLWSKVEQNLLLQACFSTFILRIRKLIIGLGLINYRIKNH
jgi:hypothetical protein